MKPQFLTLLLALLALAYGCGAPPAGHAQAAPQATAAARVRLGAEVFLETRAAELQGKRIGVVANAASYVYDTLHIVDALLAKGLRPKVIFAPEHGFRGEAEAGAQVAGGRDARTGLLIESLYGSSHRPAAATMQGLDVVIFDIQDVGTRFYTYLSTLVYMMEACAEHQVKLLVLDRPNPNGWYVAGPVLEDGLKSFVGVHSIPIVHGLTLGEYARMANQSGWLAGGKSCPLEVIRMEGYTHAMHWAETGLPWHPPSPNLRSPLAAELYPALCWFEGTVVSIGRGTDAPFERAGFPYHFALRRRFFADSLAGQTPQPYELSGAQAVVDAFTPRPWPGRAENPQYKGERCYGVRFRTAPAVGDSVMALGLNLLANFYAEYKEYYDERGTPPPKPFFTHYFDDLAGVTSLEGEIKARKPVSEILAGWGPRLREFQRIRGRFLLYP